jgi:2-keto-4-pentenoate hydratase/2-oxohepta-3-ene-1,7-dioic acid hydratase in catechol pathway
MRIVRYKFGHELPRYGWVRENFIGPLEGDPFGEYRRLEAVIPINDVLLCAPLIPGKIVGIGLNYKNYTTESNDKQLPIPPLFLKPPSSVIGHKDRIIVPPQSKKVEFGPTLAVVVSRIGRWVMPDAAMSYVFGYACANDITAVDLLNRDVQWTRGKGFDTFCPIGPWIETDLDVADVMISCHVNREIRLMVSSNEMLFTIPQIISYISSVMTLYPGDVILTGSPAGNTLIQAGDEIDISIEGIGDLVNVVIEGKPG